MSLRSNTLDNLDTLYILDIGRRIGIHLENVIFCQIVRFNSGIFKIFDLHE